MKKRYSHRYICEAIEYWKRALLTESLKPETEQRLKSAAKKFASMIGKAIKSGKAQRAEDGNFDALMAIKTTIKINTRKDCPWRQAFIKDAFGEENVEAAESMISELAKAEKAVDNLKKTTEQFNYFANEVFMIWRRDPDIAKTMGQTPDMTAPALQAQAQAQGAEDGEGAEDAEDEEDPSLEECDATDPEPTDETEDAMMCESVRMARRMARW